MAKAFGNPITVQEHREVLSATVDVESGMTDFIVKRTLVSDSGEVVSVSKIRDTAPTQERLKELEAAVEAAAAKKIQEVDLDGVE
jgi:IMP dehydrogenase/GMP reductase